MKNKIHIIIAIILILSAIIIYSLRYENTNYKVVTLKGANVYCNFTKSNFTWMVGINDDSLSGMPICRDDMIYMIFDKDDEFIYRYSISDGASLEFSNEDFKLLLNGQLISIRIENNDEFNSWLENLDYITIRHLRSIFIASEISVENIRHLARLSEMKPDVGIFIDNYSETTDTLFRLFKPRWLINFDGKMSAKTIQKIIQSKSIDLLGIDGKFNDLNDFAGLTGLKKLYIQNFSPAITDKELKILNKLHVLNISDSEIENLEFIKSCKNIRELSLIECQALTDITALNKLSGLKSLHLIACDSLKHIDVIDKSRLEWISFPSNIDQQEFELFLSNNKSVEVIDLIGCDEIQDITPLNDLKKLSCISIHGMEVDIDTIKQFTGLKFLSLPQKLMDDSTKLSVLKENLPETIIVPSAGICLGTGWLLLIFPIALLLSLLIFQFRKNEYAENNQ